MKTLKSVAIISMLSVVGIASAANGVYVCPNNLPMGANVALISDVDGYFTPYKGVLATFDGVKIEIADGRERVSCMYHNYQADGAIVGSNIVPVGSGWVNGSVGPYCVGGAGPCTFSFAS